jgi:hypothetical protein
MADDLPPQLPGETPQQYHRRVTAAYGNPILHSTTELKPLSPKTPVRVTLWTAGGILAAVFLGGWQAAIRLTHIEESLRSLDTRLVDVQTKVQGSDPARARDDLRRMLRGQLRSLTIECPRPVRKGEATAPCKVVLPLDLREEAP